MTANTTTATDTTDSGQRANYLIVTVQAHIAQTVTTKKYGRVPIVVRRTVEAAGFRPRGGPEWWPSVRARTTPFGNTGCRLYRDAILEPLADPADLRQDVAGLRNSLNNPEYIATNFDQGANSDELRAYTAACESG